MEKKKSSTIPQTTVTRDLREFSEQTGNIYKSVVIMSRRANQLAQEQKQDLEQRLQEFSTYTTPGEEAVENEEQIEISKFYEKLPKPTLVAAKEFSDEEVYFRTPDEEPTTEPQADK